MKIKISMIEEEIVKCNIMNGEEIDSIIHIGRKWFDPDIKVGDVLEFDMNKNRDNH